MQLQPRNRKEKRRKKKTTTKWTNKQQFFGGFFTLGVKGRVMSSQVPKVCNSVHTCSCIAFDNFWRRGRIFIWNYFSFFFFFNFQIDSWYMLQHPPPLSIFPHPTPPIFPHNSEYKRRGCRERNKPYFQVDFPKVCFQKKLWMCPMTRQCSQNGTWLYFSLVCVTGGFLYRMCAVAFTYRRILKSSSAGCCLLGLATFETCPCLTHCVIFCHVTVCVCVCVFGGCVVLSSCEHYATVFCALKQPGLSCLVSFPR